MSEFSKKYLELLKEQVSDEINYLIRHGHDHDKIFVPCMFCIPKANYYICKRLNDLRQFQFSIISNQANAERRKIGSSIQETQKLDELGRYPLNIDPSNLPPMFPKL